jgi:hypothetical protein
VRTFFSLFGSLELVIGILMILAASGVAQIVGGILLIAGSVFLVGAAILEAIQRLAEHPQHKIANSDKDKR